MNELRFKSDTKLRKQWFTGISFSHPAKMSLPLQLWIIDNFTEPSDTILDPMAGSGTILVACSMGRNVIAVELEQKFINIMNGNWEKIKQRGAMMGYQFGQSQIINGDARNLSGLLVDGIVTSPPYEGSIIDGNENFEGLRKIRGDKSSQKDKFRAIQFGKKTTGYGSIDKVITSPPYEMAVTGKDGIDWSKGTRGKAEGNKPRDRSKEPAFDHLSIGGAGFNYSDSKTNIGNLKGQTYLDQMLLVYQQCHAVLKSGGLCILVTKNFIRDRKEIRLDLDTIKLCEIAGFTFQERWYRKLTSQSFWRTIYSQKYPDAPILDKEDVLIFRRGKL